MASKEQLQLEGKVNRLTGISPPKHSNELLGGGYIPALLVFVVLSIVCGWVLGQFLFGGKLLLFSDIGSDTYYSYYAFYYFLADCFSNLQLPLWSFRLGVGTSVITLYQFLYDPFSLIYFIGGVEYISRLIVWVFALKIYCAAAFAYLYLRYLGVRAYASILGSILFAFNGFLMVWGQHYFFASWVVFLPLLLYAIEVLFRTGRWMPAAVCISFMALNIAICFQVLVFCGGYVLFRLGMERKRLSIQEVSAKLVVFGGVAALGLSLSAVLWLPEYYLLSSSPRISTSFFHALMGVARNFSSLNAPEYYHSLFSRIFSSNLQGIGSSYIGFLNYYESIELYAGILPLLLLPQLYIVFPSREKWIATLALLLLTIFLLVPGFSQIMNGFQYPSYRWGYNVIFFEVALSALVFNSMLRQKKISVPVLIVTAILLLACVMWLNLTCQSADFESYKYNVEKTFEIVAFVVFYCVALYCMVKAEGRDYIFLVILMLLCAELVLEHRDSFEKRSVFDTGIEHNTNVNFFDFGYQATKQLRAADDVVYRLEKNHWILSLNDSLIQNYFGLDSYNSLNTPSYIRFVQEFGHSGKLTAIKWSSLEHPYLADMLSVKYHLTKDTSKLPEGAAFVSQYGDVSVYKRKSYLPFGFTYNAYLSLPVFQKLSMADKERAFLQGVLLDERVPKMLAEVQQLAPISEENRLRDSLRVDVLHVSEMKEDRIVGDIHVDSKKFLFLSIPYDPGWTIRINGKESELYKANVGFSGAYLDKGNNTVELRYRPPYMKAGAIVSFLGAIVAIVLQLRSRGRLGKWIGPNVNHEN